MKNLKTILLIVIVIFLGVLVWENRYTYVQPSEGLPARINNFTGELCYIPIAPAKGEWKCIKYQDSK